MPTDQRSATSCEEATRIAQVLSHPLRLELLKRLNERVASPNELAKELGVRLPNVSYHVRCLLDAGFIELVETAQRRGALEHYYRALRRAWFDDGGWSSLPESARSKLSATIVRRVVDDAGAALAAGSFDARVDRHLSYTQLVLDEEGWNELAQLSDELLERALQIQAAAMDRLQAGAPALNSRLVVMHYEPGASHAASGRASRRKRSRKTA